MSGSPPIPAERVLPTLNQDGTRRRIRPQPSVGKHWRRRMVVGWALILSFALLPFLRVGGMPAILLDLAAREFTFFGRTFFATDGVLLMLLMLSIFVGIILMTAVVGRAWCGWGCPQTVYMEVLFRPIERLIEKGRVGQLRLDRAGGGTRRVIKFLVFGGLSVIVANIFLAYFVGVEKLALWVQSSPSEHPVGFLVMGCTAALVFFDFGFFREQMCTVICPYARLQAALLDKDSLIIGYDGARGEPRKKGKPTPGAGDCIDCSACVTTCPTGIDIREGMQLECIACAQCIDACDRIMDKVGKPQGLIRYASTRTLKGEGARLARPRLFAYSAILIALFSALLFMGGQKMGTEVTLLRGIGAPFSVTPAGVQNQIRVKLENKTSDTRTYEIQVLGGDGAELASQIRVVIPESPLKVKAKTRRTTSLFLTAPSDAFARGQLPITVRVSEADGAVVDKKYHLLGPQKEK